MIGKAPSLKPKKYANKSPIQTGCALIPISTNTIDIRSSSDRGRSAERIPTGNAINIQKTAPPNTNDAVTGAAWATT